MGNHHTAATFNYYALVDDLYEFIEDHQLVNPIIIGHSMGGKVAMNFALDNPAKVDKLIIVDISIDTTQPDRNIWKLSGPCCLLDFDAM